MEQELHDLMIKIDERTRNIWRSVEQLEKHQAEANGFIRDNMKRSTKNAVWISALRWIVGASIGGMLTWLAHLEGLF